MTDALNPSQPQRWKMTRLHWYHWAVIGLSLVLTLGAWFITSQQVEQKAKVRFDYLSSQLVDLLQERMDKYEEALWAGVAALHMYEKEVSRDNWKVFADTLSIEDRYPGINGVGVIHYVPPEKLDNYLTWQRESIKEYNIHPEHNVGEYWPITYIEPQSINEKAVGLDMAHETNRYTAAKRARDLKKSQITGPIILVQDSKRTPGFLFYAPWYSNNVDIPDTYGNDDSGFLGLVYAPFIVEKLMDGVLSNKNRLVNFSIHDGDFELYSELSQASENYDNDTLYRRTLDVEMFGRSWTFNIQSSALFRNQVSNSEPLFVLFGGIIIDFLIFLVFLVLAHSNKKAVDYANEVTGDLQLQKMELEKAQVKLEEKNRELLDANSELDQFAFVASHDLKAPLRGISQLISWIDEDTKENRDEQITGYYELVLNRIGRLEALLDDLLEYSRIGRLNDKIETVNIEEKVREIFDIMKGDRNISLIVDSDVDELETMVTPLEQVIRNLIGNAIKHNDKDRGLIQVSIRHVGDSYQFNVLDDGPGIPEQHRERVFELFHTLRPRDEVEGSGLGLSIIKKILDRYDAAYEISSSENGGCLFEFTWPVSIDNVHDERVRL